MRLRKLIRCLGFPILACCAALVSACGPEPTPNVEASVQARLAQVAAQETRIAESVQETVDAQGAGKSINVEPTQPPPTPTRVPLTQTAAAVVTPPVQPTRVPPTPTRLPPTPTRVPPTPTRVPPTPTRVPPTPTRVPSTPTPTGTPTPASAPPAVTYSYGPLEIPQTWTADLDEGVVGAGSDADIWFHAVTASERYVESQNGAWIAVVGTSSVGRDGCAAALLSTTSIHVNSLPEGTYVCVRTNLGRYSQFRVNAPIGPSPGMLMIGYTTWE